MINWSIEKIREGFERFRNEHNRLPTAPEIDLLNYLPSSRQIQRKFGGLEQLRTALGYEDTNFGKGKFRSSLAKQSNIKGRRAEIALESALSEKFGEVFVHTEKIFSDLKNRVDFYIYTPDGNFGIDVFYTETMRDLQKNINIKIDKYKKFPSQLFLVVANVNFQQDDLDLYVESKVKPLSKNTQIVTIESLFERIKNKKAYPSPI